MTVKKKRLALILLGIVLVIGIVTCIYAKPVKSLCVATMPLVVNNDYSQELLAEMWAEIEPDIKLEFVERDYGSTEYPSGIDVLGLDYANLNYLSALGYFRELKPEEIEALDALMPFAESNMITNGKIYGVPQFLCGNFLVYHREDIEMDSVKNLQDLCEVLAGGNVDGLPVTESADKIWMDIENQYSYYALDATLDENGSYVPFNKAVIEANLLEVYDTFLSVSSRCMENENKETDLAAFGNGCGRAAVCFSEQINMIGLATEELKLKQISLSDNPNIPLIYMDGVVIGADVKSERRYQKCLELVNLMTSKEYMQRLLTYDGNPQYFIPAREDVFLEYAERYSMYEKLYDIISNGEFKLFCSGKENLEDLLEYVLSYKQTH